VTISKSKDLTLADVNLGSKTELWIRLSAFLSLRAPNTRETYLSVIKEWCRFLGFEAGTNEAAKKMIAATDLHAIAYKNWLETQPGEKPRSERKRQTASRDIDIVRPNLRRAKKVGLESTLSNATIAKKFAALRRIYRMLLTCDFGLKNNPFDSDRVPPPPKSAGRKRPTEMINFALVKEIIETPDTSTPKGIRDRAILSALFGGGLRRSEVAGLRVGDVRKTSSGICFLYLRSTKAKRDAEQALPAWASDALKRQLEVRRKQGAVESDFLFTGFTGQAGKLATNEPISISGIYKLFKYYCGLAGAGDFISPHSARATAITKLLSDGISHRLVQEFSRHSSIQMVELYDKRRLGVEENPGRKLKY